MAQDLNQEEVLIARNNDTGQVGAVTGLNEDGTPKMTDVKSAKLSREILQRPESSRSLHVKLRAPV